MSKELSEKSIPDMKELTKPEQSEIIKQGIAIEKEDPEQNKNMTIDEVCNKLQKLRARPLLVLYYPDKPDANIENYELSRIYNEFRRRGFNRDDKKIPYLDVVFHTLGGNPDAGYMIAQVIRSFCEKVDFLIPYHAASAGTLISFSANKILLGAYSYLSPIDSSLGDVPLMAIDYFINFAVDCRKRMEQSFRENGLEGAQSDVESQVLTEMLEQVKAINVGRYYRERTLTGYYSERLLNDYMFADNADRVNISNRIIRELLFNYPAHEFYLDEGWA